MKMKAAKPKAEPCKISQKELSGHLAWRERIINETAQVDRYLLIHLAYFLNRSLKKGIALGIVESVPILKNPYIPAGERYNDDEFFQGILEESKSKFPAKSLLGLSIPMSPRFLAKANNKKALNQTADTPFGLFPAFESQQKLLNGRRSPGFQPPVYTSIRTYAGKQRLRIFCTGIKKSVYESKY